MCSRCWEISSPYTDTSTGRSICLNCAYHAVGQALRGAKNLKGQILGVSGDIVYITTTGGNQWAQSLAICAASRPTGGAGIALSLTAKTT